MLRELHTTACLQRLQVDLQDKSGKLSFFPFCTYAGGERPVIPQSHYHSSLQCQLWCGKCLKQAFVSSSALHNHKRVCIGFVTKKSTMGSDCKPSSSRGGDGSHGSSTKAAPKKNGKAPAADSQGSSTPPASQTSPCCSGREVSCHHKSHKDSKNSLGEKKKKKKKKDMSPARRAPATRHARTVATTRLTSTHNTAVPPMSLSSCTLSIKYFIAKLMCLL